MAGWVDTVLSQVQWIARIYHDYLPKLKEEKEYNRGSKNNENGCKFPAAAYSYRADKKIYEVEYANIIELGHRLVENQTPWHVAAWGKENDMRYQARNCPEKYMHQYNWSSFHDFLLIKWIN